MLGGLFIKGSASMETFDQILRFQYGQISSYGQFGDIQKPAGLGNGYCFFLTDMVHKFFLAGFDNTS